MKKILVALVLAVTAAVVPVPAPEATRPPRDVVVVEHVAPDGGSGRWSGGDPSAPPHRT